MLNRQLTRTSAFKHFSEKKTPAVPPDIVPITINKPLSPSCTLFSSFSPGILVKGVLKEYIIIFLVQSCAKRSKFLL